MLDSEGIGCNLQHYNPVIDLKVARSLKPQLIFGGIAAPTYDKVQVKLVEECMSIEGDNL